MDSSKILFPSTRGDPLSSDSVQYLVNEIRCRGTEKLFLFVAKACFTPCAATLSILLDYVERYRTTIR